ncbi:MAG: hypothetical protein ACKV2U_32480 [Bryobacteraceae bacterium]
MTHQDAINAKLVERYFLREMADSERDAFEEHYFSCALCAEEVVTAVKFVDNARRPLLRLEPESTSKEAEHRPTHGAMPTRPEAASRPKPREEHWWDRWLALTPKPALVGLCAGLALALAWPTKPAGVEPEVTGSYFVTATRAAGGAPRRIMVLPGQRRVALLFNHTDTTVSRFRFELANADGRALQQFDGDAPRDTNDIQVMVPVARLRAGIYTLRVKNAASHSDVATLPFELAIP